MMKATTAMKMNITFCGSPMPNSANVSGISAAMGMLRPNTFTGAKNALIQGKQPHKHAERNRHRGRQRKSEHDAPQADEQIARQRVVEPQVVQSARGRTSPPGLGATSMPTSRSSCGPRVRNHHMPNTSARHNSAQQDASPMRNRPAKRKEAAAARRRSSVDLRDDRVGRNRRARLRHGSRMTWRSCHSFVDSPHYCFSAE